MGIFLLKTQKPCFLEFNCVCNPRCYNTRNKFGEKMQFDTGNVPLARRVKRDLDLNLKFKRVLEAYWSRLGHKVQIQMEFHPVNKVYTLRSDLVDGIPTGNLSEKCVQTVLKFKAPSPYG